MLRRILGVDRLEDTIKVTLTLAVAGTALAAGFAHVHDQSVDVLHAATGKPVTELDWFGWAVAVISEITPLVGLLSLRRRHAAKLGIMSWGLLAIVAGMALSIWAQCAWVAQGGNAGPDAYLIAIVPALSVAIMSKVVFSDLDVARILAGTAARKAEIEAAREAELADLVARAKAETARAQAEIRKAETEIAAARAEVVSGNQRADAAEERAAVAETRAAAAEAISGNEAAARRAAEAVAEAASGKAAVLDEVSGAARQARAAARQLQDQLDQARAQLAEVEQVAAQARTRHAKELAAARDQAQQALATWSRDVPVSPAPAGSGRGRRAPQITLLPGVWCPDVESVSASTVDVIVSAFRNSPGATAAEISGITGVSDRTIRKVVSALTEIGAVSADA